MGVSVMRGVLGLVGVLLMLGGIGVGAAVGPAGFVGGGTMFVAGAVLLVGVVIERTRYRSEAAERRGDPPGPGGGEPTDPYVEPRFRPTGEIFVDPTTDRRMRVLADPSTGERRYMAER